jgi:hypothetical protein
MVELALRRASGTCVEAQAYCTVARPVTLPA